MTEKMRVKRSRQQLVFIVVFIMVFIMVPAALQLLLLAPVLEIGTNFTATCVVTDTDRVTADDLYWNLSQTTVPRDQYAKINGSALAVTVPVVGEQTDREHRPEKPENVSCQAVQEVEYISTTLRCSWAAASRQTAGVPTTYTLNVAVISSAAFNASTRDNEAAVDFLTIFPDHMMLDIWVEAHNWLGRVESEHLKEEAGWFVKTNPPSDVQVVSERSFPTSLLINWTHPIPKEYVRLTYRIRFCPGGSESWTYVPLVDTSTDIQSFRLQNLRPATAYVSQVSCKNAREGHGYWSAWSANATAATPEDRPGKPDLWRIVSEGDADRLVQFICKDPVRPNGRITGFNIRLQDQKVPRPVNRSESGSVTVLQQLRLADGKSVKAFAAAHNAVGKSAEASLVIPDKAHVTELKVWPQGGRLWVEWTPPNSSFLSEYVVQWVSGEQTDWQRENRSTRRTAIKGDLERFVCYNVSVHPLYAGRTGRAARAEAFLEQGAPLEAPAIRLKGKPGHNEAELVWKELPLSSRRGFITNYTIFYTSETTTHKVTLPADATSYKLTSLTGNTKIKVNFWPRIPDPGESTIGTWAPDYPVKAEPAKESRLSGVSVLDVDACDGKSVFEEDKAGCLPLKKDKYLSEEHSSGIGGSSCMSSPRQSVSDSDEGGDMADTTAGTVQYSSVVAANNGYKGQTPHAAPQPAAFSRSESTQPLLDSEESADTSLQEGGGRGPRRPGSDQQGAPEALDFCPLDEDGERQATPTDGQEGVPASSYRLQLDGYRPQ
ncbi:Interleukin-6 receptor subunit beta [Liparis tanakae]|uniref:Interleukin-6 receptor subunit beta n=1 Tax=Liparis tanakae TaxID=230148 RepID=A0A4Z2FV03_9TELE|nr:Interleukin-6 receptor subunit beta [Liparis tanakae]